MSLADAVINASGSQENYSGKLSVEDYPDRFFDLHPSTCKKDGYILCDNQVISADPKLLMRLLDHPRAKLDSASAYWLFERIKERAPVLDDRFIVVSEHYMWDRWTSQLLLLPSDAKTTNNKTTRRRLEDERRRVEGIRRGDDANPECELF